MNVYSWKALLLLKVKGESDDRNGTFWRAARETGVVR